MKPCLTSSIISLPTTCTEIFEGIPYKPCKINELVGAVEPLLRIYLKHSNQNHAHGKDMFEGNPY